jgi:hypothetical protein
MKSHTIRKLSRKPNGARMRRCATAHHGPAVVVELEIVAAGRVAGLDARDMSTPR